MLKFGTSQSIGLYCAEHPALFHKTVYRVPPYSRTSRNGMLLRLARNHFIEVAIASSSRETNEFGALFRSCLLQNSELMIYAFR
jgi:hypothetical protein